MKRLLKRSQANSLSGTASITHDLPRSSLPDSWPHPNDLQADASNADLDVLIPLVNLAVNAGLLTRSMGMWGILGHLRGYDIEIDVGLLPAMIVHTNHSSAELARDKITTAIGKRLQSGNTLALDLNDQLPTNGRCFPLGAVAKRLEPESARLISDHKASQTNTKAHLLPYEQDTLRSIDAGVRPHCPLAVQDVADAFPTLPLLHTFWPFFLFRWYQGDSEKLHWFLNIAADFGTSTLPFLWFTYLTKFCYPILDFLRVRIPGVTYVDDLTHFLDDPLQSLETPAGITSLETQSALATIIMDRVALMLRVFGANEKASKRAFGYIVRLLGWVYHTQQNPVKRVLPQDKRTLMISDLTQTLLDAEQHNPVSATRIKSICGQLIHAEGDIAMQPSLGTIFNLLVKAETVGHHTAPLIIHKDAERSMREWVDFLHRWDGSVPIYNRLNPRPLAPPVFTDASGGRRGGGGFVSLGPTIEYDHWPHDRALRRHHINYLEGYAVLLAAQKFCKQWRGCLVPLYVDNLVILGCLKKHRSSSGPLNKLLFEIFQLQLEYDFRFELFYITSKANVLADALSRQRLDIFEEHLEEFARNPWWGMLEEEDDSWMTTGWGAPTWCSLPTIQRHRKAPLKINDERNDFDRTHSWWRDFDESRCTHRPLLADGSRQRLLKYTGG